jgi:peptidoglycan/LPS O-acetylase OafA/YrhL
VPVAKPVYFPILDSLRFLASAAVFLAHSVVFFKFPGGELHFSDFIKDAGYYGVVFFYTLSGFLITYLLLKEKKNMGTIAVKDFYIRRALRIWPLYYLIVFLSFFVFPYLIPGHPAGGMGNWKIPFLLYMLFLPNVAALRGYYLSTCFHTYTIGYEEQFYLFWPLILRKAGRHFGTLLVGLFILPLVLEIAHLQIIAHGLPLPGKIAYGVRSVLSFINYSNMSAFIAGAIAAFLFLKGGKKLQAIGGKKIWGWLLTGVVLVLMCFTIPEGLGYVNVVSILFSSLILNLVLSGAGGGKIGLILARGGKISYGIYIYHPVVLIFVSFCMAKGHMVFAGRPMLTYLLYLTLSFALLLAVAAVSYKYFEQFFLRKKRRFTEVTRLCQPFQEDREA